MGDIEKVNICTNILSLANILNSEWRDSNLTKIALSFCVRGIMVTNEKPISGWNPVRKPLNDQINVQRCVAAAEIRWYESIINKKSKNTTSQMELVIPPDIEEIIIE